MRMPKKKKDVKDEKADRLFKKIEEGDFDKGEFWIYPDGRVLPRNNADELLPESRDRVVLVYDGLIRDGFSVRTWVVHAAAPHLFGYPSGPMRDYRDNISQRQAAVILRLMLRRQSQSDNQDQKILSCVDSAFLVDHQSIYSYHSALDPLVFAKALWS